MDESNESTKVKKWLRIYPDGEWVKAYRIGTSSIDENSDVLENSEWELFFGSSDIETRYELSDSDSYLNNSEEEDYIELGPCTRISDIISAFKPENPKGLSEEEVGNIKNIFENPKFDSSVSKAYREFIKDLSKPELTEEQAILSLFKNVIKECGISNPIGIEVDATEEDSFKVGYHISTDNDGFDKDRLGFLSFDNCWFQGLSDAFEYMSGINLTLLNIIIYDGIFYANTDTDDGFYNGCENTEVYLVNKDTLKDANNE